MVSGASGLIGTALVRVLRERGEHVQLLVRHEPTAPDEHYWHPGKMQLDQELLAGADAVISLNGTSVGRLPWTAARKAQLWESRIGPTRVLAQTIRNLGGDAPRHWLSASATGFYGSQPGVLLDETAVSGESLLARLTIAWEEEALLASDVSGVALLRTAPVLHPEGVLKPMMLLTKLGLAGPLGSGTQYWPWISLDDEVRAIVHVLDHELTGPVNLAAPGAATANEIGAALAQELHRPFWLPAPVFALNLALSADATESLLTSDARVDPARLRHSGFAFQHSTPSEAIRASLIA